MVPFRQELQEGFKHISYGVPWRERLALTLTIMLAEGPKDGDGV